MPLSHFAAMAIFAFLVSVALSSMGHRTAAARVKLALLSFVLFLAIGVGIAWLMYPFSR